MQAGSLRYSGQTPLVSRATAENLFDCRHGLRFAFRPIAANQDVRQLPLLERLAPKSTTHLATFWIGEASLRIRGEWDIRIAKQVHGVPSASLLRRCSHPRRAM